MQRMVLLAFGRLAALIAMFGANIGGILVGGVTRVFLLAGGSSGILPDRCSSPCRISRLKATNPSRLPHLRLFFIA